MELMPRIPPETLLISSHQSPQRAALFWRRAREGWKTILLPTVLWLPPGEVGMTEEMRLAWRVILRTARVDTAEKTNKHGRPEETSDAWSRGLRHRPHTHSPVKKNGRKILEEEGRQTRVRSQRNPSGCLRALECQGAS